MNKKKKGKGSLTILRGQVVGLARETVVVGIMIYGELSF